MYLDTFFPVSIMVDSAPRPGPLSGRRVLIVTLGTRGDVQPFIALCDGAALRGPRRRVQRAGHVDPRGRRDLARHERARR